MKFDPMTGEPVNEEPATNETAMNEAVNSEAVSNEAASESAASEQTVGEAVPNETSYDLAAGMAMDNKPKKKTGLIAGIIAAIVLVIGIIAAVIVSNGVFLSKADQVEQAVKNTFADCNGLMENFDVSEITKSKNYTISIDGDVQNYGVEMAYRVKDDKQQMAGSLLMGGIIGMDFGIEMSGSEIRAQIPAISDKVFSYNCKEEKSGYLAEMMGKEKLAAFDKMLERICDTKAQEEMTEELYNAMMKEYESMEFKEASKETFEIDGKDRSCKGYTVAVSRENVEKILDAWEKIYTESYKEVEELMTTLGTDYTNSYSEMFAEMKEELADMPEVSMTFYIYDKELACIALEAGGEKIQLQFQGGDTRAQNMCLIDPNGDKVFEIKGSKKGSKEVTELIAGGVGLMTIEYDTKTGNFILSTSDDSISVKGSIKQDKKGLRIALDELSTQGTDTEISGNISIESGAEMEEISGDEFDLGNASESEFMDLSQEISNNLGLGY